MAKRKKSRAKQGVYVCMDCGYGSSKKERCCGMLMKKR